ncbi:L-2-keto-3-deoxyarabonate dehydratase [Marinovum algicola]|uniref:4-hydroxy-tetrahydrodipicolinate synthase n=1 Tax=Marinovum algicola TaxID=42444 RepID=A0A975WFB6_9RHOB|nr:dihydrodipicolinate synthase family protein [Marinovum algicola]SEK10396.1 4-hydroxy-tetrahydrodipicolinate synthase [Marinovum algicola]SLN77146.1 L-2-keto-3-deoxyarabonate dehydratase [Marinovum algicola]
MSLSDTRWRGVYVIVTTPFDDDLNLDLDGLRNVVRFNLKCGVHGLVAPANASEVAYLSDAERKQVVQTITDEAGGRVPVIAGVSSSCAKLAVAHARVAQDEGADGILAMPPTFQRATQPEIVDYFRQIAAATRLPIMLQNYAGAGGTSLSPAAILSLVEAIPQIEYVKEETPFSNTYISEILALAGDRIKGVMGGIAGINLFEEHARGACGTMPACESPDIHVGLWAALERQDPEAAREIFEALLPLLSFEALYGIATYKSVLTRRGVIAASGFRQTGAQPLDAVASARLDTILNRLAPLMHKDYRPAREAALT